MRLKGKIALVTGAGRGIGEATAKRLAEEGARVCVTDIIEENAASVCKAINDAGGSAWALQQDVANEDSWAAVAQRVNKEAGGLDVLVLNAGIEMVSPIEKLSYANWRKTQSINVDGVFLGCRALLPLMKSRAKETGKIGSIVMTSSIAGFVAFPNQLAYTASKGAVRLMAKGLAVELAGAGAEIRVNSVHPGVTRTPMMAELIVDWAKTGVIGTNSEAEVEAAFINGCPMKRWIEPVDIANGVLFLASDESRFMTGAEIVIDGGWIAQ